MVAQIRTQLQTVSISDDWYAQGLVKINEWEQDVKNTNTSHTQHLETKIQETDQKLNKLVDSFLDNTLDKETYLQKKEQIIKQKTDLNQKKSDFRQNGISWLEPLKEFWKSANLAKKLAISNDFQEIKSFVAQHGSNPHLGGKTVSLAWTGGFEIVRTLAKKIIPPFNTQNFNTFGKTDCIGLSG